jgi:hypothetical protein
VLIEFIGIIIIVCLVAIFLTGIFLFIRMNKTDLYNLFGLAAFFIVYGIQLLGEFSFPIIVNAVLAQMCIIFLLFFIKNTFYKESLRGFPLIILIFVLLKAIDFFLRLEYNFQIPQETDLTKSEIQIYYIFVTIAFLEVAPTLTWLSYSSFNVYYNLKRYEIEPWVKIRYLLIGFSSLMLALSNISSFFLPYQGGYESVNPIHIVFIAISFIIFSFGNLIAWLMPKKLKIYFNRNYKPKVQEDLSENELMEKIKSQLSEEIISGDN